MAEEDAQEFEGGYDDYDGNYGKKRKRNRFLRTAKRFGRKGCFGHGAKLEEAQYTYLVNILDAMRSQESKEDRQLMANNVLGQLEGREIKCASNQLGSRALENLLNYTDEETFAKLMETFAENFRVVCCDSFASHVVQRMLHVALFRAVAKRQADADNEAEDEPRKKKPRPTNRKFGRDEGDGVSLRECYEYSMQESFSDEHRKQCKNFVKRLSKFLANNLEEFVWETVPVYIVRQCILNLSGLVEMNHTKGGGGSRIEAGDGADSKKLIVPEKWQKLLTNLNLQLMAWPTFADTPYNEPTSFILQSMLRALATIEDQFQLKQLCSKLHNEAFTTGKVTVKKDDPDDNEEGNARESTPGESNLPKVYQQESSIRLLEMCLSVVPADFLREHTFNELFRGHLKELSLSREQNFAVQKLIDHVVEPDMLEAILGELEGCFEGIISAGHAGIVRALAKACGRLANSQGKFVKLLLDALHCNDVPPAKMLSAILYLTPAEQQASHQYINVHGSLILQAILDFNKPIKFVTALLEMQSGQLANILSDARGSFIANAFIESRFVGEKSREKMVRHLEGQYAQLVQSSHGSRVVELMYGAGNPAQRENIVRELAEQCAQLNNTPWGIAVNKRLLVNTYKQSPARWKIAIKSDQNLGKMFGKLISDEPKRKAK